MKYISYYPCPLVSGSVWTMVVSTPSMSKFHERRYMDDFFGVSIDVCIPCWWPLKTLPVDEALGNQWIRYSFCGCSSAWSVGFCINGHEAEKSYYSWTQQHRLFSKRPSAYCVHSRSIYMGLFSKGNIWLLSDRFIMLDCLIHGKDFDLSSLDEDIFHVYICCPCSLLLCHCSGIPVSSLTQSYIFQQKACHCQFMPMEFTGLIMCYITLKPLLNSTVDCLVPFMDHSLVTVKGPT